MEDPCWALVADDPISDRYAEDINLLLLSFQICMRASVFIKYRLCREDACRCARISRPLWNRLPNECARSITSSDLGEINDMFQRLLEMQGISDRTHNAIYFTYRGLSCDKMIDSFALLSMALESLFSPETRGGVTKAICSRVPAFLGPGESCNSKDVRRLYDLRSKVVHGKVVVQDDIKGKLPVLRDLQHILLKCLKKMLKEQTYRIYCDDSKKEEYFRRLVGNTMTCPLCGGELTLLTTTLPVKEDNDRIVIIKGVPLLKCGDCHEYLIDDAVREKVDATLSGASLTSEVEVLSYVG